MSEEKGLLTTCNRCGTTIFRKYTGQGDLDGGYTTFDRFEPLPDDWLYLSQIGDLCPVCANEFKRFIHNFIGQDKVAPSWRLIVDEK